jgi:hypothetical protein
LRGEEPLGDHAQEQEIDRYKENQRRKIKNNIPFQNRLQRFSRPSMM